MSRLELVVAGGEKAIKAANVGAHLLAEVVPTHISKLCSGLKNQAPSLVSASEKLTTDSIAWTGNAFQFPRLATSFNGNAMQTVKSPPKVGDLVGATYKEGSVSGELVKWQRTIEGDTLAIVQLRHGNLVSRAPGESLNQISPTLWADKSGGVFRGKPVSPDEIPSRADLSFVPNMFAVSRSKVHNIHPPTDTATLDFTSEMITSNFRNPDAFLFALGSAPQRAFDAKLLVGRQTPFNPEALNSNCMSCTAGILKTFQTGRLTTAKDIENATGIGAPTLGRFKNQTEALDWFSEAAGVRIVNAVTDVARIGAGRPYAAEIGIPTTRADASHLVFAFKHNIAGRRGRAADPLIYDGQNNIRFIPGSLETSRLPKAFYELEFIGAKSTRAF